MDTLLTYVPKAAQAQIKLLLEESQIEVLVTKQRLSKHGDFRFYPNKNAIKRTKVFLYYKNRNPEELDYLKQFLKTRNIEYKLFNK